MIGECIMKKDNYKSEFEEHRQEIKLEGENETPERRSRVELHRKARKPKRQSRNMIINIILVLFTLIPVVILVYVVFTWNTPAESKNTVVDNEVIKFETIDKKTTETADKDSVAKPDSEPLPEPKPDPKPEVEPEPVPTPDPTPKPDPKPEPTPNPTPPPTGPKTHVVGTGENLYRISLKYYNSGDGVNKIMAANGMRSNEIVVGQKLIIP